MTAPQTTTVMGHSIREGDTVLTALGPFLVDRIVDRGGSHIEVDGTREGGAATLTFMKLWTYEVARTPPGGGPTDHAEGACADVCEARGTRPWGNTPGGPGASAGLRGASDNGRGGRGA